MSEVDPQGCVVWEGQRLPIATNGGWWTVMLRAPSEAILNAAMLSLGALREVDDDEGNTTLVRGENVANVYTYRRAQVPAVLDEEGNVTTPAVMDPRVHANIKLRPEAQVNLNEQGVPVIVAAALTWLANGSQIPVEEKNASEDGVTYQSVTVLDPATITSPDVVG